jgi:hypothetical protein
MRKVFVNATSSYGFGKKIGHMWKGAGKWGITLEQAPGSHGVIVVIRLHSSWKLPDPSLCSWDEPLALQMGLSLHVSQSSRPSCTVDPQSWHRTHIVKYFFIRELLSEEFRQGHTSEDSTCPLTLHWEVSGQKVSLAYEGVGFSCVALEKLLNLSRRQFSSFIKWNKSTSIGFLFFSNFKKSFLLFCYVHIWFGRWSMITFCLYYAYKISNTRIFYSTSEIIKIFRTIFVLTPIQLSSFLFKLLDDIIVKVWGKQGLWIRIIIVC